MYTQKQISLLLLCSICFGAGVRADEYTKEKICLRLNPDKSRTAAQIVDAAAVGIGVVGLVKLVPELQAEIEARANGLDKVKAAPTNTEMAIAFYEREKEISKRILAGKGGNTQAEVHYDGEKFAKTYFELEDKELGSSSLNNLLKKYQSQHDEKAVSAIRALMAARINMFNADKNEVLALMGKKNPKQMVQILGFMNVKEVLTNQVQTLDQVVSNLTYRAEQEALVRRWDRSLKVFTPNLSPQTRTLAKFYDEFGDKDQPEKKADLDALKKSLREDYKKSGLFGPLDPKMDKVKLAATLDAREKVLDKMVNSAILDGVPTLGRSRSVKELVGDVDRANYESMPYRRDILDVYADGEKATAIGKRDFGGLNKTSEGTLLDKKLNTCSAAGLVGVGVAGLVGSLSYYCDNEIAKNFEMNLPKASRDQFGMMKSGYAACVEAVEKDPTLFTAIQTKFKIADEASRSPAATSKGK